MLPPSFSSHRAYQTSAIVGGRPFQRASFCKLPLLFFSWRLLILKAQWGFSLRDFFENIPNISVNPSSLVCIANSHLYLLPQVVAFEIVASLKLIQGLKEPFASQCAAWDTVTHRSNPAAFTAQRIQFSIMCIHLNVASKQSIFVCQDSIFATSLSLFGARHSAERREYS